MNKLTKKPILTYKNPSTLEAKSDGYFAKKQKKNTNRRKMKGTSNVIS
jgi:hypothetical protein